MGAPKAACCDEDAEEARCWGSWRGDGDLEARARLLELHLPFAKALAASIFARRLHDEIGFDDYLQLAHVGLIEAMNRFDPARGVRFRTFASRRIHGSVLDGLEIASEKHQQIAARKRLLAERALSMVECREEANGTSASAARTQEQLLQYVAEAGIAFALGWLLEGTGLVDTGDRHANLPFYRSVELRELRERIVELVATLPPQESAVVRGHYLQAQPFDSIAARLGVSGGRVSQLHKRALARLRGMLHPTDACDVAI